MDCFLVLFLSDFSQEVINRLGEKSLVFSLNSLQTSNFLTCLNAPINSSPNFNFQKLNLSVPHSIAEERAHIHRGGASMRAPMCNEDSAGEAHLLDGVE